MNSSLEEELDAALEIIKIGMTISLVPVCDLECPRSGSPIPAYISLRCKTVVDKGTIDKNDLSG